MNTLKACLLIYCFSNSLFIHSQTNTTIGLEAAATGDLFTYTSEEEIISSLLKPSGYMGFNISEAITKNLSVEIGIIAKSFNAGYVLDIEAESRNHRRSSGGFLALQFPIRLHLEHPLFGSNWNLYTSLGYHYCISIDGGNSSGSGSTSLNIESGDILRTSHTTIAGYEKTFSLMQTGIGLFYEFSNDAQIYLSGSYYTGFKDVMNMLIQYQINDLPVEDVSATSNGDYWGISIGFRHPFKMGGQVTSK